MDVACLCFKLGEGEWLHVGRWTLCSVGGPTPSVFKNGRVPEG